VNTLDKCPEETKSTLVAFNSNSKKSDVNTLNVGFPSYADDVRQNVARLSFQPCMSEPPRGC
jgi:hypothetical protein